MTSSSHLLVVDDHAVLRRGVISMLVDQPWVASVEQASTGKDAVRLATTEPIDVVVLDLVLPDLGGVEVCRQILRASPSIAVLMLSMNDDPAAINASLRCGARGYVLKDQDPDEIVAAVRIVAGGGQVLGARVSGALLEGGRAPLPARLAKVSPRDLELLAELASGRSNAQISRRLCLSEKTIRNQMSSLFTKIDVTDRVQAALLAQEAGLRAA